MKSHFSKAQSMGTVLARVDAKRRATLPITIIESRIAAAEVTLSKRNRQAHWNGSADVSDTRQLAFERSEKVATQTSWGRNQPNGVVARLVAVP